MFLNYRGTPPFTQERVLELVRAVLESLSAMLLDLVNQPLLMEPESWQLRSLEVAVKRRVAALLIGGSTTLPREPRLPDQSPMAAEWKSLFGFILSQARQLAVRKEADHVLTSLSSLNARDEIETLDAKSSSGDMLRNPLPNGIVRYAAETGRIVLINDVGTYASQPEGSSHPKYVNPFKGPSRAVSELAVPVLIQGRVVGVLNIESQSSDTFNQREVLLMFHLAETAALALRQYLLWKLLNKIITRSLQIAQVPVFSYARRQERDRDLLKTLCDAVSDLGFHAVTRDLEDGQWARPREEPRIPLNDPRTGGWTRLVAKEEIPFALLLHWPDAVGPRLGAVCRGNLDPDSGLFAGWSETLEPKAEMPDINPDLQAYCQQLKQETQKLVRTDIAMPIPKLTREGKRGIRAVVWATSERNFGSITADDVWAMSVLCHAVARMLALSTEFDERYRNLRKSPGRPKLLRHFSDQHLDLLTSRFPGSPDLVEAMMAKYVHSVLVLSVDIRGSSKLAAEMKSCPGLFKSFITEFHESGRELVKKNGGVFDKTCGDGFQALFHVVHSGVFAGLEDLAGVDSDFQASVFKAVQCAADLFSEFERLSAELAKQSPTVALPGTFCLGAGLASGEGFVGSLVSLEEPTFEFSCYGEAANKAGHLVGSARLGTVRNAVRRHSRTHLVFCLTEGGFSPLPVDESGESWAAFSDTEMSLLLVDPGLTHSLQQASKAVLRLFPSVLSFEWQEEGLAELHGNHRCILMTNRPTKTTVGDRLRTSPPSEAPTGDEPMKDQPAL